MIVLRIIHILAGIFWVGFAMVNLGFLQPSIRATGTEGQKVIQHLTQKTKLMFSVYTAATLTMVTGVIQYGIISQFRLEFLSSGWGLILTIGSVAGVIAWILAVFVVRGIFNQLGQTGRQLQSQGENPDPQLLQQLQELGARLGMVGKTTLSIMIISVIGMAAARYASF